MIFPETVEELNMLVREEIPIERIDLKLLKDREKLYTYVDIKRYEIILTPEVLTLSNMLCVTEENFKKKELSDLIRDIFPKKSSYKFQIYYGETFHKPLSKLNKSELFKILGDMAKPSRVVKISFKSDISFIVVEYPYKDESNLKFIRSILSPKQIKQYTSPLRIKVQAYELLQYLCKHTIGNPSKNNVCKKLRNKKCVDLIDTLDNL